jgi:Holliday junction resolvase RusA-like endonuclease
MSALTFTIPGPMRGKGRPRFVRATGRAYTPQETENAEAWVRQCAVQAGAKPVEGPLALILCIFVDIPASWSKSKRAQAIAGEVRPTNKPDLDNIIKLIGDSLNGIAWVDDKQIVEIKAGRFYASASCTTVQAVPL